jgi:hypothetical protein
MMLKVNFYQNLFLPKLDFYQMFAKTEIKTKITILKNFLSKSIFIFDLGCLYWGPIFWGLG